MDNVNIISAQYVADPLSGNISCIQTNIDGTEMSVPLDPANSHYAAILEWVAEGNTISDAD